MIGGRVGRGLDGLAEEGDGGKRNKAGGQDKAGERARKTRRRKRNQELGEGGRNKRLVGATTAEARQDDEASEPSIYRLPIRSNLVRSQSKKPCQ